MKQIVGFPDRMRFTPVPNFFFSTLLPQISDIDELKVAFNKPCSFILGGFKRRKLINMAYLSFVCYR